MSGEIGDLTNTEISGVYQNRAMLGSKPLEPNICQCFFFPAMKHPSFFCKGNSNLQIKWFPDFRFPEGKHEYFGMWLTSRALGNCALGNHGMTRQRQRFPVNLPSDQFVGKYQVRTAWTDFSIYWWASFFWDVNWSKIMNRSQLKKWGIHTVDFVDFYS